MESLENQSTPLGLIAEIQRMSTEDGPGIRTTAFFKGCALKCTWCHNPECISSTPQIHWIESRCIGCKTCLDACPQNALDFTPPGISIDRDLCDNCGLCADECPSTALELVGVTWNSDDLIREMIKDKAYFDASGGGVTLSGGDPSLQAPFAALLLKNLQQLGIQTAIDTCGVCSRGVLDKLILRMDLVLCDLKEIDVEKHRSFTGQSNAAVFENLIFIYECMVARRYLGQLWIRTPVIPGATAREDNIRGIGQFIAENLGNGIKRWELCAFNNLCKDKYRRLGLNWEFENSQLMSASEMENLADVAKNSGVNPAIVHWSGTTRLEEGAGHFDINNEF